jgi:hypothetical protein
MGTFAELIEAQIETEIERRLAEYVSKLASHFFTTEREVYKVIRADAPPENMPCKGHSKTGKPCKNKGKHSGYCHIHRPVAKAPKNNKTREHRETDEQIRDSLGVIDAIF